MTTTVATDTATQQYLAAVENLFALTPVFGEAWWQQAATLFDTENFVLCEPDSLPYAGRYVGLPAFQGLVMNLAQYWSDLDLSDFHFTAGGDRVTVSFQFKATAKSTSQKVSMPFIEIWRFEQHKVVEILPFYWDTACILKALG